MSIDHEPAQSADITDFLARIRGIAEQTPPGQTPEPFMRGTFAMYPMEDGGVMVVTSMPEGPMTGTHHIRIRPGMIRALATLTAGPGQKMKALKGIFGSKQ